MRTIGWLLAGLLSLAACSSDSPARVDRARLAVLDASVPGEVFRRVLWQIRGDASRGTGLPPLLLVEDTATDLATGARVPAAESPALLDVIEGEDAAALISNAAMPCWGDYRVGIVAAARASPDEYLVKTEEYDLRIPEWRYVAGQVYTVRCGTKHCQVTDIHLGEEPDIELRFGDASMCSARGTR